jgi:hypothetical protein
MVADIAPAGGTSAGTIMQKRVVRFASVVVRQY